MTLDVPFNIGDPLYWVDAREQQDGPAFAMICEEPEGVLSVNITRNEDNPDELDIRIVAETAALDDDLYEPGDQYACLNRESAMSWIQKNLPGAIVLTGERTVRVELAKPGQKSELIEIIDDINELDKYVPWFQVSRTAAADFLVLYNATAAVMPSAPPSADIIDASGNTIHICGQHLIVRTEPAENGMLRLVNY